MLAQRHRRCSQHYISIGSIYRVIPVVAFLAMGGGKCHPHAMPSLTKQGQSPNVVSMLDQRRIRWANIETVLGEWHVFAGEIRSLAV